MHDKDTTVHVTSEQRLDDGVLEREFILGGIPGTLWTPGSAESAAPVPLILTAHNNGLPRSDARLVARARTSAAYGHAVATIDAAGCGSRPHTASDELARADLRRAMRAGEPVDEIFESLVGPLVEGAVPEWRTTLDALLALPGIGGPVGYSGWAALGIRLAVAEPRIRAASFFAGGYVPCAQREEARLVTVPLLLLLQWDDEGNPGSGPWTCSTPSARARRRCTPTWAGTPAPRGSNWTTRTASSAAI